MRTRLSLLWVGALLVATGGCFDALVGASCAEGYVPCQGRCVAVCTADNDGGAMTFDGPHPADDGGRAVLPDGGLDRNHVDARTWPDTNAARIDGARAYDGSVLLDARGSDAIVADGARPVDGVERTTDALSTSPDAVIDRSDAAARDASAFDGPRNDGALTDTAPTEVAPTSDVAPDDGPPPPDAAIPPDAPPPVDCGAQTLCPSGCANLNADPDNCGACGFSCGTGLCVNAVCQQRQAGHLVLIGHDYAVSRNAMDNIVGNSVFLASGTAVNVLAYQGAATVEEIRGTDNAIQKVATSTGRTWRKTVALASDVQSGLAFADVFLIYAQAGASDDTLQRLGSDWATALADFVQAGKTIVVLEGWYPNGGTYQIVQQANLFHAVARHEITGQTMTVARAGDAVATRVPQTYRGERSSVWFQTLDQVVVVQVTTDGGPEPVVIHLVF